MSPYDSRSNVCGNAVNRLLDEELDCCVPFSDAPLIYPEFA